MQNIDDTKIWIAAIINSSDDAIISKDLNNIIVSWNKGAEQLYGYTEQEVIGKPIAIIIPEDKLSDIPMTAELIENKTYIHHLETVRIAKSGKRIDVSVSVSPIMNSEGVLIGSSAIARDITERKANELKILRSEDRYRKIVELSPDSIIIHQEGIIVFVNQAALKLFAADSADQLVGKSLWTLYTPDQHGIVRAHNQSMKVADSAISNIEHTVVRLDGKQIIVETSSCPINFEEKHSIYTIMRDISERKKFKTYLEMQYSIAGCLALTLNMIDGLNQTLDLICEATKLSVGRIWLVNTKQNVLDCITNWTSNMPIAYKSGEGMPGKIWATEEAYWTELEDDQEFKLDIGVPIINNHQFIGVLELLNLEVIGVDNILIETLTNIANQLGVYIKYKNSEKENIYLCKHDPISSLSNRLFFEETLTFEIYRAKSKNTRLAVLLLDIESFSDINESMSSKVGDQILKECATILVDMSSFSDNVARFGGDQFAIIFDDFQRIDEITDYIANLKTAIDSKFDSLFPNINIKFNIGVGLYPEDGEDTQVILKNASIALTKAKDLGHGAIQFCTSDMMHRASNRIELEKDLRSALAKQEFLLYYQPVVNTSRMEISGFEALLRWRKGTKTIPPIDFISILEDTQLIIPVGEWILDSACSQAKQWQTAVQRPIFISINISPVQFKHGDVFASISQALTNSAIDPACVKVEITESAIMTDVQQTIKLLNKIKTLGVTISIDDFGTGYSSLNYLRQLPIDYLKIDRSFIIHMIDNLNDAAIIRTIISLAENLGFKVIAEGVETEEQVQFLRKLGCVEIQGYFYSRPLPVAEVDAFLKQKL